MHGIRRLLSVYPAGLAFWATGLCLIPATSVLASGPDDDTPHVKEEIVVTATRGETKASQVGSTVTVLEGEDLRERGFSNVAEALRSSPGLEIARSGGPGQITSVFLRGGSSSQTLVLLDGIRLNSSTTGAFDFGDLSLDEVERIEIVRGPQSPLYGSEAAAGVIQILTRRGEPGLELSGLGEIGEDEHHRLRLSGGGGSDSGSYSGRFSLADESIEAVSAADARRGNTEPDRHDNSTFSGSLSLALNARQNLDFDLRYFDGDAEIDGFAFPAGPVDDLDAALERQALIAGLVHLAQWGTSFTSEARLAISDDDLEAVDPTDPFGSYGISSRTRELGAQAIYDGGRHRFTVGASREERQGGTELTFEADVTLDGIYLQDMITLGDKATLTLGVRRDDHSSFGSEETGRFALALELWQEGRLHASWGQGFKAPTLNDLFYPFFGNPDLLPERSEAFDFGLEQSFAKGRVVFDVTYFEADFEDLIAFDFVTFLPQNIADASSRGVESQLRWRSQDGALQAGVTYTWNETEDGSLGTPLARRPKGRATADVSWRKEAWRLGAHVVAVRDRIDSDGSVLEDYDRFDVSVAYSFGRVEPSLRLLNVTDDDTSEIGGYGTQGRTAILAVNLNIR